MFRSGGYNVKKAAEKTPPKKKKKKKKNQKKNGLKKKAEIKELNEKQSPQYSKKKLDTKTATRWVNNKTFK